MNEIRVSEFTQDKSAWEALFTYIPFTSGGIYTISYEKKKGGKVIVKSAKKNQTSIFKSAVKIDDFQSTAPAMNAYSPSESRNSK